MNLPSVFIDRDGPCPVSCRYKEESALEETTDGLRETVQ